MLLHNKVSICNLILSLLIEAQDEFHKAPAASNEMDLSTLPSYSLYPHYHTIADI